ncbi:sensor histidine kinase [Paractinoplanes lichenicola]|uniref:histidine kinase n=1 Tax=Paractinoplanes lichenicola TaxID=2802976 RepID=A0ABS1VL22_9ACTN|nr:sensor histidine kinase [Actinoplanes lichenicola]MBL7255414.1 histidine kinase [Actinoplanes lichenicola]
MTRVLPAVAVALCVAATVAWAVLGRGDFWPRWVYFGFGTVAAAVFVFRRALRTSSGRRRWLVVNAAFGGLLIAADLTIYVLSGGGYFWPVWTTLAVSALLGLHAYVVSKPPGKRERELAARVTSLARSRSGALDRQAAELKRVERDLHDGAQARMVSLALTLGLAGELLRRDPDGAEKLLLEARSTARSALDDLRAVMHSIHPPVLADRGLLDAVRALALDLAVPVTVAGTIEGEPSPAVETAAYFAVAECLGNVVKHSGATSAQVVFAAPLRVTVTDDGHGGVDPAAGSGLRGITERLEAVDGRLEVTSPAGGPTTIMITIPI